MSESERQDGEQFYDDSGFPIPEDVPGTNAINNPIYTYNYLISGWDGEKFVFTVYHAPNRNLALQDLIKAVNQIKLRSGKVTPIAVSLLGISTVADFEGWEPGTTEPKPPPALEVH